MKKYIATTTINPPTKAMMAYLQLPDWGVVVAGDLKTNHALYQNLPKLIYLSPEDQEKKWPALSKAIGWNCLERRNFAILQAYELGAEVFAIMDDDNVPNQNWGKDLLINKEIEIDIYHTDLPVFDPVGATQYKHLWHRGFPLQLVPSREYHKRQRIKVKPDIQADFWNGDPDIDAICRMIYNPKCEFKDEDFPIMSNVMAPFNSQNTFLSRTVIPDYFLFPFIGRQDDIWAAYYAQAVGHRVVFGKASVISDRSLGTTGRYPIVEDMKKEYIGYENNLALVNDLSKDASAISKYLPQRSLEAFNLYQQLFKK